MRSLRSLQRGNAGRGLRWFVKRSTYFLAGVELWMAEPERTDLLPWERAREMVRPTEVSMKMTAPQVVRRVSRLEAPRGPKAVWEPWPPKAPATSEFLPCCRRTTPTRKRQTMTWRMTRRVTIMLW